MNVLVLGRTGQVARALADCDGQSDLNIIALGRPKLDITQSESILAAVDETQPEIVINAAAYTAVDQAELEREDAFAVNALSAGNVAAVCAKVGRPLIHISTDYVFDGMKPTPYVETDPVAPLGVYGESKLAGERRVAEAMTQHLILRTAWVYSAVGKNFIKTMLRLGNERSEVSVVQDQIGSPTFAPHLASAICSIAKRVVRNPTSAPWGIYHAVGSGEASWYDVARYVFDVSQSLGGGSAEVRPIPTSDYPTPAKRPANSRLNGDKLATHFDTTLPDWHVGVESCVQQILVEHPAVADGADRGGR